MEQALEIKKTVSQFISKNFLFDEEKKVQEDVSLLQTGIVDSTGILELIGFLEITYGVQFQDDELIANNFDSVTRIATFLLGKLK